MKIQPQELTGTHIRLEPLATSHIDGLVAASAVDPSIYQWSAVPIGRPATEAYIATALAARDAGTALPFATIDARTGSVIGSTRFFDIEWWSWPEGRHPTPDGCEIGYTWLTPSAIRTPANTEAKFLMLTHAFEAWRIHRVCLHTDERNERSRAAIARIGGRFEGILRSHRLATDFIPRNSARFSIVAAEWPEAKARLQAMMRKYA